MMNSQRSDTEKNYLIEFNQILLHEEGKKEALMKSLNTMNLLITI